MNEVTREQVDLYVVAQQQFARALSWMDGLKEGMIDYLINPKRTTHVHFPVLMDDDTVRSGGTGPRRRTVPETGACIATDIQPSGSAMR